MLTRERASEPCVFKHVACSTHNDIEEDDHETTTTITMISRNSHRDDNSNKHVHNFGMCAVKHNMSAWVHVSTHRDSEEDAHHDNNDSEDFAELTWRQQQ